MCLHFFWLFPHRNVSCNLVFIPLLGNKNSSEISPSQPLIAVAGDDVVLPCQLEPPVDAVQMTIEWGKPDLNPGFVFVRQNGQELQTDQNTAYKGRVSLSIDKLKHGDVSLKLSKVKVSDRGRYRCYIPQQIFDSPFSPVKKCESSYTSNPCITMALALGAAGLILGGLIGSGVMWKYTRKSQLTYL
uniref:Ig-like domain-containing protein n=1 Tax=Neolamprologus brichardi TaxID=32507 RepID=A0A3Q4I6Y7_NEOBR